jgi:hypothetical protein
MGKCWLSIITWYGIWSIRGVARPYLDSSWHILVYTDVFLSIQNSFLKKYSFSIHYSNFFIFGTVDLLNTCLKSNIRLVNSFLLVVLRDSQVGCWFPCYTGPFSLGSLYAHDLTTIVFPKHLSPLQGPKHSQMQR